MKKLDLLVISSMIIIEAKFIEAVKNEDYKSKHYFNNKVLGNLNFYDNLLKNDVSVIYNYKYIT